MIELQELYPVEQIGQKQYDAIIENNRVMCNLKQLVQKLLEHGDDAEDIAKIAWYCGFGYAESRYYHRDDLDDDMEEITDKVRREHPEMI